MLTEQDALELYTKLLRRLHELGAEHLVRDIEEMVFRGELRDASERAEDPTQTPLSTKEALRLAIHMLLAFIEPAFQISHTTRVLSASATAHDTRIEWVNDRLDPVGEARAQYMLPSSAMATVVPADKPPSIDQESLVQLRELAERLSALADQILAEDV